MYSIMTLLMETGNFHVKPTYMLSQMNNKKIRVTGEKAHGLNILSSLKNKTNKYSHNCCLNKLASKICLLA